MVIVGRMVGGEGVGSLVCMSVSSTTRSLYEPTSQHCAQEATLSVSPGIRPAVHSIELRLNRRESSYPSATIFRSFIHGMHGTNDDAPVVQNTTKIGQHETAVESAMRKSHSIHFLVPFRLRENKRGDRSNDRLWT